MLKGLKLELTRIGWKQDRCRKSLYVVTHQAETSVRNTFKTMQVTTDCNDGGAQSRG
jgi:hypothetical protein